MQAVQFIALDVLSDALHTVAHVAMHKVPCLKRFHRKHHEKDEPVAVDTFYNHPIDTFVMTTAHVVLPLVALVPLMGIGLPVIVLFLFWSMFTSMSHHSTHSVARAVSLGCIPGRLYPEHHLTHHKHPSYNYGESWIYWDYLMGTRYQEPGSDYAAGADS